MSRSTSIAKLIIAHQTLNCLTCNRFGNCQLTRELTNASLRNRLDIYSIELIRECGDFKELMKVINEDGHFMDRLLKKQLIKKLRSRAATFREGLIVSLDGFSLAIPNGELHSGAAYTWRLRHTNDGCAVELITIDNDYLNYMIALTSHVVPKGEYSLNGLIKVRELFLRGFVDDEELIKRLILASLGLGELSPLINEDVEDIFITSDSMYINHQGYGLCRVVNADHQGVARQLLKLANLSGVRVSVDNPSGKFSLNLLGRKLRITVDRWPLTEGVAVHIRLHKKPFSIIDLISLGTIDPVNAAKLILAIRRGSHLLIAGPPGSGKTTLLNALDATLPMNLRRIYIDETDEALDLPVPSVKVKSLIGKVDEVLKSLHRGYGILVIGELREREHFEALVHGINSGMQVMGTTHAVSRESLMGRLRAFGVDELVNLDSFTLVFMGREGRVRRVVNVLYPGYLEIPNEHINKLTAFLKSLECLDAYDCMYKLNGFMKTHGMGGVYEPP
ncbi:ATPase, T2SS/T4P/T4SS family [Vulcanisaeta thermophila]|uniref:ATPase, T2SS/T4P/T4SS family n=1 Tax=Vulcanisaeta thermophila TaxID=867917 RepID=UPI0008530CE5|nr:ATPase, T2SS/T4P/T4SS family [Vulcanisaeta thermophila]